MIPQHTSSATTFLAWPERKVWIAGELTCPVCGRKAHGVSGYGDLYPMCQGKSCSVRWRAVTLWPGTTPATLLDLFGPDVGGFLIRRLGDPSGNDPLVAGAEPEYLQIALHPHEYARAGRWTTARGLLQRLLAAA